MVNRPLGEKAHHGFEVIDIEGVDETLEGLTDSHFHSVLSRFDFLIFCTDTAEKGVPCMARLRFVC